MAEDIGLIKQALGEKGILHMSCSQTGNGYRYLRAQGEYTPFPVHKQKQFPAYVAPGSVFYYFQVFKGRGYYLFITVTMKKPAGFFLNTAHHFDFGREQIP